MVKGARVLMCRWIVVLLDKLRRSDAHPVGVGADNASGSYIARGGWGRKGGDVLELR